jgi:hypothetical protein
MPLRAREGIQSSCIDANSGTSLRNRYLAGVLQAPRRVMIAPARLPRAKWGMLVQRKLHSGTRMPPIRPGPRALSSLHAFYTQGTYDCLQKTVTDRI